MLVKLRNSRLFDTDPTRRFAKEYGVDESIWLELWKRYKVLDYTIDEMVEYFTIKTHKTIRARQIRRWIFLTDVFALTKPAREKKALVISTEMFGKLEKRVIDEITRGVRHSGVKKPHTIV